MKVKTDKREYFWKSVAVIVIAIFAVQSLITYRALTNNKKAEVKTDNNVEYEEVKLTPRKIAPYQPQQVQPQQLQVSQSNQLAPKPIPKLNVNVNSLPGVKPSTNIQSQQQQFPQRRLMPGGMNINIHQSPFGNDMMEEMAKMEEMMKQMMSRSGMNMSMRMPPRGNTISMGGGSSPAITVDNDNNYVVTLQMPGLSKSEIKAQVNGNMLTVSGVQRHENTTNSQGGNAYMTSYSSFQNSFSLPGPVKSTGLKFDYKDDVLTVKVPQA